MRPTSLDATVAAFLQRRLNDVGVRLELWDGTSAYAGADVPVGDLVVGDRRTLYGLLVRPNVWFGEAYMASRLNVRGELERVLEALYALPSRVPPRFWKAAARLGVRNTPSSSRHNVHHHYDLGNDFYKLWLDKELVYTCAYFEQPEMSLEAAQRAKLDLVCRKLRLHPGESVVEAGCGWGALALHMARNYGVVVKAFNLSREQLAYARARAAREGLASRVEFIEDDYRSVRGRFDAFVSVGMIEHVGLREYGALAEVIGRTLRREGGRGLLHFIGRDSPRPLNAWIRRRIFPGAYPPTLGEVVDGVLRPAAMSVLDVENLRLHYARTLSHWARRFAAAAEQVCAHYGRAFQRAWELYLSGSEAAFATSSLQLFQIVFAPAESDPPYWARAEMYETESQWSAATR